MTPLFVTLCSLFMLINASFSNRDLRRLRRRIRGLVITSNDDEYNDTRQQYDYSQSRFPSVIVLPRRKQDVKIAMEFVLKNNCEFVVRSGKHATGGFSTCDDCVMIDLQLLDRIRISECDPNDLFVIVQSGVLLNDLFYELEFETDSGNKYWLPGGAENVGVGGHVHGGGWGIGMRKYGMVTDQLLEARVLVVDENNNVRIKRASPTRNPDLFFCIRGTVGPSCGIVLAYKLRIYPQTPLYTRVSMNILPGTFSGPIDPQTGFPSFVPVGGYLFNGNNQIIGFADPVAIAKFYSDIDRLTTIKEGTSSQQDTWMVTTQATSSFFPGLLVSNILFIVYDGIDADAIRSRRDTLIESIAFGAYALGGTPIGENGVPLTPFDENGVATPLKDQVQVFQDESYMYIRCTQDAATAVPAKDPARCFDQEYLEDEFRSTPTGIQSASWNYDSEAEYDTFTKDPTDPTKASQAWTGFIFADILGKCPTNNLVRFCGYYISTWGGAVANTPSTDTAFPWRNTAFDLVPLTYFTVVNASDPELGPLPQSEIQPAYEQAVEWINTTVTKNLYNNGLTTERGFANYQYRFLEDEADYMPYYYGNNEAALRAAKCNWDKNDLFTNPQGIPVDTC